MSAALLAPATMIRPNFEQRARSIIGSMIRSLAGETRLAHDRTVHVDVWFGVGARDMLGGACNADRTAGHRVAASARLAAHVELENAGDHDHGLWPIPVLEHREFHRLGTVHEHAAAKTALILDDPVAAAVPADPEQGLGTSRRGRFTFIIHGTFPFDHRIASVSPMC